MSEMSLLQSACRNQWKDILGSFGFDTSVLTKKAKPCPFCGGDDRFSYHDKGGNGEYNCRGCGGGDGFDLLAKHQGIENADAIKKVAEKLGMAHPQKKSYPERAKKDTGRMSQKSFDKVADELLDITPGTPAYKYLVDVRGLTGPFTINMGYHPNLGYWLPPAKPGEKPQLVGYFPAIVSRIQTSKDHNAGYHYIYLDNDGNKAQVESQKKMSRPLTDYSYKGSFAVRLGKPVNLGTDARPFWVVGLSEGIENGQYAQEATGIGVYAGLNTHGVRLFEPPQGVHHVYIFHDLDENEAGQRAAVEQARYLLRNGISSTLVTPAEFGVDWIEQRGLSLDYIQSLPVFDETYGWEEPVEIRKQYTVAEFNEEMLPPVLLRYAKDVARTLQCPLDFPAVTMVSMLSAIIGASVQVRPKGQSDWPVICNLWGAIVGQASMVLKTPVMETVLRIVKRLQKEANAEYDSKFRTWEKQKRLFELNRSTLERMIANSRKRGDTEKRLIYEAELDELVQPEEPKKRIFIINNTTVERLKELMRDNPRGILLFNDELSGLFASFEKEGRQEDKVFLLEAWNGFTSHDAKRKSGDTDVKNSCITVFGGIQPTVMKRHINDVFRVGDDGFMARIQLGIMPNEPEWAYIDEKEDVAAKENVYLIAKALAYCDWTDCGAISEDEDKLQYFRFDADALALFEKWFKKLHLEKLKSEYAHDELMRTHMGKYRSLMPSLALVFWLVECVSASRKGNISIDCARRAIMWCDYLETHAKKIYGMAGTRVENAINGLLEKIENGQLTGVFTVKDLTAKGWRGLHDKDLMADAITALVAGKWLKEMKDESGEYGARKPAQMYEVNPKGRKFR